MRQVQGACTNAMALWPAKYVWQQMLVILLRAEVALQPQEICGAATMTDSHETAVTRGGETHRRLVDSSASAEPNNQNAAGSGTGAASNAVNTSSTPLSL